MAWTGLTAAALWQATTATNGQATRLHAGRFLAVFVVAVILHTIWGSLATTAGYGALAAVSLGLLAIASHRLARAEHASAPQPLAIPR
jgi:protease PrsW